MVAATLAAFALAAPPELLVEGGFQRVLLDESPQGFLGGGLRVPLAPHVELVPEAAFLPGDEFEYVLVQANLRFPLGAEGAAARPYLVAGFGLLHERDKRIDFSTWDATLAGGGGLRLALGRRLSLSPEVQLGWGVYPRVTVALGFVLGD